MGNIIKGTSGPDRYVESQLPQLRAGDAIQGLEGDDTFVLDGSLFLTIEPGPGNDTVDATASTGPVWVRYAESSGAIRYDQGTRAVLDGWGGTDTLLGANLTVVGSLYADTFTYASGFVYGLGGDDVITMKGTFHGTDPGPGNDTVVDAGRDNTVVYHDAPGKITGSLATGKVSDGYGTTDSLTGVTRLMLPAAGSDLQGSGRDESFVIGRGGAHRIDAGGGTDTLEYPAARRENLRYATADGWLVVTNTQNADSLVLRNVETLRLGDATVDLTQPVNASGTDFFAFTSQPMPSLAAEYATFSGRSVMAIDLDAVDLDRDGRPELVAQLYELVTPIGLATDGPTPNRLVILSQDASGQYRVATSRFLAAGESPVLAGESRQTAVGDVNGDGYPDIAYSTSQEDGRDGNADNRARASVLLSDASGTYHVVTYGSPNWNHAVGLAPQQAGLPGIVITAGFQGPPTVVTYGGAGSTTSIGPATLQPGTLLHLPWLDDPARGDRYFYADVNTPSNHSGGVPGLFRYSAGGTWTLVGQESEARYQPFGTVTFTTWQLTTTITSTATVAGRKVVFAGHYDADVFRLSPSTQPLVVANLNVGQLLDPNATVVDQGTGTRNANYLDFIRFDPVSGPSFVDVPIRDQDVYYTGQFSQVLDVNRDGYDDIVFHPYSAAGQPIVYLNDTRGGLYNAHLANYLPTAPSNGLWGVGATSLLFDANQDGLLDLLMWPGGQRLDPRGPAVTQDGSYRLYLAQKALGTGPGYANGADLGAPGFNEDYYLGTYADARVAVEAGQFASGLAHYLAVGRTQGRSTFARDVWVHGSAGDDTIVLREGHERADGLDGNDDVRGGAGDDVIDGGNGIDTARYAARRGDAAITKTPTGFVTSTAADGKDTLSHVERLAFADLTIAYDVDAGGGPGMGHAGVAAKVLNVLLGKAALSDPGLVGVVLGLIDRGMSQAELLSIGVAHPLFLAAAGATGARATSAQFVQLVYRNVFGVDPGAADLAAYAGLLDGGSLTQAQLALLAADSSFNAVAVDIVGLASTGLDYLPAPG